jgi:hypothetical protein
MGFPRRPYLKPVVKEWDFTSALFKTRSGIFGFFFFSFLQPAVIFGT